MPSKEMLLQFEIVMLQKELKAARAVCAAAEAFLNREDAATGLLFRLISTVQAWREVRDGEERAT